MFADDWVSSSCKEVEGIEEAVGGMMASMQQFSLSQQSRSEVRTYITIMVHIVIILCVLQQTTSSVRADITELQASTNNFKVPHDL